ncbi:hypothetical protein, partial [Nostoc sp.]|uniref:hypothetical protein n=1 Tax=Nostoc sp. TaxID=1180 RepID=UPI002FFB54AC
RGASGRVAMPEWLIGSRINLSRSWGVSLNSRQYWTVYYATSPILSLIVASSCQTGLIVLAWLKVRRDKPFKKRFFGEKL